MPKKKKNDAKQKDPNKLSPLEKKLKDINLENEMLDKALKERQKKLKQMEELNAQERLLTGTDPEPEQPEDDMPHTPGFMPRNIGFGGGGVLRNEPRTPEQAEEFLRKQEEFERHLSEFQSTEGKVHVYRLKDGNNWAKMGSYSAKDWGGSLETVAKKFGGGTFKVRLHAPDGTFAGEQIVEFDEEAYPKPSAIAALAPVKDNSADMMKVIMEMQASMHRESQAQMSQFMNTMAAVMGNKASLLSSVQDLATFKELFKEKGKSPMEDMNTLLTVLQQGMSLGQQTAPVEGEQGILGTVLKSILSGDNLSRVGNILKAVAAPMPAPVPEARPQAPAPRQIAGPAAQAPAPVAHPNPPPPAKKENDMNLAVMAYKPVIMGYAKAKQSPKKTAEIIVSRVAAINEGWLLIVDDFLKMPTTKEEWVYKYAPELREHDEWVTKVMKAMSAYIKELMEEAEEQAEQSGDAAPAGADAGTDSSAGSEAPPAP